MSDDGEELDFSLIRYIILRIAPVVFHKNTNSWYFSKRLILQKSRIIYQIFVLCYFNGAIT